MKGAVIAFMAGLHMLDGRGFSAEGQGPIALMYWRADCPPCLIELRRAADYLDAAGPMGRLIFVGLQDAPHLRHAAERLSLPPEAVAQADDNAETVLKAYRATALPLAVILTPAGKVCFQHEGLLGTDTLREQMKTCRGGHARH